MKLASPIIFSALFMILPHGLGAESWREMAGRPNANFYKILAAHEAEEAAKSAASPKRSAAAAQSEMFEELAEGEYQFERWRDYVEVRVKPSGDLLQLGNAAAEMSHWMGLGAAPMPPNSARWTFIGPAGNPTPPYPTWTRVGHGRVHAIRFHPTDPKSLFIGTPGGGLWISRDAGVSWNPSSDKVAVLGVSDVAVDPKNPNIIYISTGDSDGSNNSSIGVLKSIDGGKNWSTTGLVWSISEYQKGGRILIRPDNTSIILVAASNGVYRSTDAGATFTLTTGNTEWMRSLVFKPGDPNTVYAAVKNSYTSTDGGATWSLSTLSASHIRLAVSPAAPGNLWAYTGQAALHLSTDGGRTFSLLSQGETQRQGYYNLSIAVSPLDPKIIVTGLVEMHRSRDGGLTWSNFQGNAHADIHALEFYPGTNTLLAGTDGGVYKSVDGGAWIAMNGGLGISEMYRIGVSKKNPNTLCNGLQDNGTITLTETGQHWVGGGDGFECFFDPDNQSFIYLEAQHGEHMRCTLEGASPTTCVNVKSGLAGSGIWDTPWSLDPNVSGTVYTTRASTLYKSVDRGDTWVALGKMGTGFIYEFKVAPSNSNIIYAVLDQKVYRSGDGGATWNDRGIGLSGWPTSIAVDGSNADKVWVSISGYDRGRKVFLSTNGGQSWISYSEGLPNLPANTIVSEGGSRNGVYVGMDVGVFYRNDDFTQWQPFFDGLPNVSVSELEIAGAGASAKLNAATYGRGAWRTPLWGAVPTNMRVANKARPPVVLSDFKAGFFQGPQVMDLQFQLNGGSAKTAVVELTTPQGRIVFRQETPATGFFNRRIELPEALHGTYFFQILGTDIIRKVVAL